MADKNTNIILALFVIAFAIFGGLALLWAHGTSESIDVIRWRLKLLLQGQEERVGLPLPVPAGCEQAVKVTLPDATVYVSPHRRLDGSLCSDACLADSAPQTCLGGECVGACAGECPSLDVNDCPEIELADAVAPLAGGALCGDGKCLYLILNPSSAYFSYFLGFYLHYKDNTALLDERMSRACLDFIADSAPAKKCLKATFLTTNTSTNGGIQSMCLFTYECARYSVYAGQSTGVYFMASSAGASGQPVLTTARLDAIAASAKTVGVTAAGSARTLPRLVFPRSV